MQLFNILQNDVEPLPEPWRTVLLILFLLGALVIPLLSCAIVMVRRRINKRRVEEMGSSWKDIDDRIQKKEDSKISNIQRIVTMILIVFAGIIVMLMQILGPIVRDVAVVILLSFAILFIVVICPIAMIWGMRIEDRRNSERIRLAQENKSTVEIDQHDED
jgi:MFS family permease